MVFNPIFEGRSLLASTANVNLLNVSQSCFENFVEGKSNQLARAASRQVAGEPGHAYNPLFIYGGVGLGKTHLMHAVGNLIRQRNPGRGRLPALRALRRPTWCKALQHNTINEFKRFYRTRRCAADRRHPVLRRQGALPGRVLPYLQCAARRPAADHPDLRPLPEGGQGLEERLKSRFGWGLTVAIEPPELETSVAILMSKAQAGRRRPAGRGRLLHRQAHPLERARAGGRAAPRDREFALHRPADHAGVRRRRSRTCWPCRTSWSPSRTSRRPSPSTSRSACGPAVEAPQPLDVARPRQVAMALAKELTNHSLPEIGDAFGGRDHTTVLHACRKVQDFNNSQMQGANHEVPG
jgi:chromosomal replication initiator protein